MRGNIYMLKKFLLLSSVAFLGGIFTPLFAQWIETEEGFRVNLYIDLDNAIQQIPKIIFAVPNPDGSWKEAGQVEVTQDVRTLMVGGSLITNYEQRNRMAGEVRNSSILGGSGNTIIGDAAESTIIGGEKNRITTSMSLIAGGKENTISTGDRSTILGGKGNTVSGSVNTVIGGKNTNIKGSNDTIIGTNNHISGNNSLAIGSGATINANASFAWNDGSTPLTVTQSNVFVVKGQRGLVVSKDTPHSAAALSIGGTLRVQVNDAKNAELGVGITCRAELAGTVKSVKALYNGVGNTSQICPCLCNGKNRVPMITTPQCTNACEGRVPQGKDKPVCNTTTFRKCLKGEPVPASFSYVYGKLNQGLYQGATADGFNYPQSGQANTGIVNTWYWTCRNPETNVSVECHTDYYCKGATPANSVLCRYSSTDNKQKDDRELKQDVTKELRGATSNRCENTSDKTPKSRDELKGQDINCREGTPSDADQSKKCEFYCPDGRHPETDGNCHKNSCKSEDKVSTKVRGDITVTYQPGCIDTAGDRRNGRDGSITVTHNVRSIDGGGRFGNRTFTATFACSYGDRSYAETLSLDCDGGYWEKPHGAGERDNECLSTKWEVGAWGSCSASPYWGSWGSCSGGKQSRSCYGTSGTQSRSVVCKASDGTQVDDSYCSYHDSKPETSKGCSESCYGDYTQACSQSDNSYPCTRESIYQSNSRGYCDATNTTNGRSIGMCAYFQKCGDYIYCGAYYQRGSWQDQEGWEAAGHKLNGSEVSLAHWNNIVQCAPALATRSDGACPTSPNQGSLTSKWNPSTSTCGAPVGQNGQCGSNGGCLKGGKISTGSTVGNFTCPATVGYCCGAADPRGHAVTCS